MRQGSLRGDELRETPACRRLLRQWCTLADLELTSSRLHSPVPADQPYWIGTRISRTGGRGTRARLSPAVATNSNCNLRLSTCDPVSWLPHPHVLRRFASHCAGGRRPGDCRHRLDSSFRERCRRRRQKQEPGNRWQHDWGAGRGSQRKIFYPFTFPITAGPGTLVVMLTLSAHAGQRMLAEKVQAHAGIAIASAVLSASSTYVMATHRS